MTVTSPRKSITSVDSSALETLVGYNARRASLAITEVFIERMAVHDLRMVEFSVLSLVGHNPGITSRQLSSALSILPPNLVSLVNGIDKRGLVERQPHPVDGRAVGLHLTSAGETLLADAEQTVAQLEIESTASLSAAERKTLIRLLQKIYRA
nr:MarR family transcriptional regulator [uncultured Albidiferax sp.]